MSDTEYAIEAFHPFRQLVVDGMDLAAKKHHIHGLVEIDITETRKRIRQIREVTGQRLSFTGCIINCSARAVDEDKHLHTRRDWRNRLILFDDVDVSFGAEQTGQGQPVVLQGVIQAANRKSVWEIHAQIRELQSKGLVETRRVGGSVGMFWFPVFVRRFIFRMAQRVPTVLKSFNGTVVVASVGMFGRIAGWGIPLAAHTLCLTVGGIESKPVIHKGQLQDREHLCLTVTADHDIVDGAPAARFIQRLARLVQAGAGLSDPVNVG